MEMPPLRHIIDTTRAKRWVLERRGDQRPHGGTQHAHAAIHSCSQGALADVQGSVQAGGSASSSAKRLAATLPTIGGPAAPSRITSSRASLPSDRRMIRSMSPRPPILSNVGGATPVALVVEDDKVGAVSFRNDGLNYTKNAAISDAISS